MQPTKICILLRLCRCCLILIGMAPYITSISKVVTHPCILLIGILYVILKFNLLIPSTVLLCRYDDQFVVAAFDNAPTADSEMYAKMNKSVRDAFESKVSYVAIARMSVLIINISNSPVFQRLKLKSLNHVNYFFFNQLMSITCMIV